VKDATQVSHCWVVTGILLEGSPVHCLGSRRVLHLVPEKYTKSAGSRLHLVQAVDGHVFSQGDEHGLDEEEGRRKIKEGCVDLWRLGAAPDVKARSRNSSWLLAFRSDLELTNT
jgi:hypothetical protein